MFAFRLPRPVRFSILASLVLLATATAYPGGLSAAYSDAGEIAQIQDEMIELQRERRDLESRAVIVNDRIALKEALIDELLTGRMSLEGVALRFVELNGEAVTLTMLRRNYPGATDLESNALNVLGYASQRVGERSRREAVLRSLRAEFARQYGHPPKLSPTD